jgi:RND family efflux transporter MFP subunit
MKRRAEVTIAVILIVIAGILIVKKRKADLAKLPPPQVLPAVVSARELAPQNVTITLPAMGVVASDISAVLSTRISGQITAIYKREGDTVKKGEILASIDARDLEARKQGLVSQRQGVIAQIEAKKAEAKALETSLKTALESHARTKELLAVKGASPEQYSQEEAEIARLKASLDGARKAIETLQKSVESLESSIKDMESQISYATLNAPIDGRVSQLLARPGDLATPGKPILKISSKSGLYLTISLPDRLRPTSVLLQGQEFPLTPKDQTSETGLVQYVSPLPPNSGFVEGQFVNVNIVLFKGEAVLVPMDALLTMGNASWVFTVEPDGKAKRIEVTVKVKGVEGAIVEPDLANRKVILAKPDILLRVATGVPIIVSNL